MKIVEIVKYAKNQLKDGNVQDYDIVCKILIEYFFDISRNSIAIHMEDEADEEATKRFDEALIRVIAGVPVQYITNKQEFMNISLYVDENVLIPQPDTEILVEKVIEEYKGKKCKVLDLCTGSGAIGIAIAKNINEADVFVSDISAKALEVTKKNSDYNLSSEKCVHIIESNMFDNIMEQEFDCVVSNPPYIKTSVIDSLDMQVQSEPHLALDGGTDGLEFYRIISDNAYKYIKNGGKIFLEIGYDQKNLVMDILKENGHYVEIEAFKDYGANDRVISATIRR
jgi:release factor glutamine methyltransferase